MRISDAGLRFIKAHEGLRLEAYPDPGTGDKPWTIGYGHTGPDVVPGLRITAERAEELLRADVARFEAAVTRLVTVPLSQPQFDALVSFAFNTGEGALARSTLLRMLNAGDYAGAGEQFDKWVLFGTGSAVAERNVAAAETVARIVVAATGAPNLQGAVESIQADPAKRLEAANAVEAQWYTLVEAGGGGIDGARKFNVSVASAEPWKMPAVWISSALLALVFMVVGTVLWADGWSNDIRLQVVTATLTIIGMVGSFWLGTSASSARKDDALFRSADR
jgi:lysozyme